MAAITLAVARVDARRAVAVEILRIGPDTRHSCEETARRGSGLGGDVGVEALQGETASEPQQTLRPERRADVERQ